MTRTQLIGNAVGYQAVWFAAVIGAGRGLWWPAVAASAVFVAWQVALSDRRGVEGKLILRGVNLEMRRGETHALMGPNGSGKSTLGLAILGHPKYEVTEGSIELNGENVTEWDPDQRARGGVFMAFQRPVTIPGVKMADFLRHATTNVRRPERGEGEELIPMREFRKEGVWTS